MAFCWIAIALQELRVPYDAHVVNLGGLNGTLVPFCAVRSLISAVWLK